ncbi:hypothetical protein ABZ801_07120 [Actinomadura sp. NPDC047616]|uniref:hypothetical protein n=1 Tax=Actinomadura sp. NPDC047616 TaxID=3155914 RepID=UPI00340D4768
MAQRDGRHASQGFTYASPQTTHVSPQETSANSQEDAYAQAETYARFWEDRPGARRRSRNRRQRPQKRQRSRAAGVAEEWLFGERPPDEPLPGGPPGSVFAEPQPEPPELPRRRSTRRYEPPGRDRSALVRPLSERRSPEQHPSARFPAGGRFPAPENPAVGEGASPDLTSTSPDLAYDPRGLRAGPRGLGSEGRSPARAGRERADGRRRRGGRERRGKEDGRTPDRPRRRDDGAPAAAPRPRIKLGQTDRLSAGALTLSIVVGLALLAVVERAVLEGGPIGTPQQAGSAGALPPARDRSATPRRGESPARPAQSPGASTPTAPDVETLTAQIRRVTLLQRGPAARQAYGAEPAAQPVVATVRMSADRTWAFGTTAIPVPDGRSAMPEVAFFVARWSLGRWQTALSGSSAFAAQLGRVPAGVMSADEARVLARFSSVTAQQAATATNGSRVGDRLMLPWKVGEIWSMGTAAEGGAQPGRPLGTLAFSGGDGRVLAAGDGRFYRFCRDGAGNALVMVLHDSGLASAYYRMRGVAALRDGSVVRRGDLLGRTGTARPCGGAPAPRAEVQFGLRRGAEGVPLEGARIGGWTFREQANPLLGFAQRGLMQVLPGGLLANLGPVAPADDTAPPGQGGDDAPGRGNGNGKGNGNGNGGNGAGTGAGKENPAPPATPDRSSTSEDPQ